MKRDHYVIGVIGTELRIYELIRSEIFDALILLSESLIYPPLKEKVCAELTADPNFYRFSERVQCLVHGAAIAAENCEDSVLIGQMKQQLDRMQKQQDSVLTLPHYHEMKKMHDMMLRKPQADYTLIQAAESLRLNRSYFNRIYQQIFGVSYHQDHILARLRMAKHLLLSTDDTAVHISECCGYTDSKYYLRQFAAETGCSPKQYRNLLKGYLIERQTEETGKGSEF